MIDLIMIMKSFTMIDHMAQIIIKRFIVSIISSFVIGNFTNRNRL